MWRECQGAVRFTCVYAKEKVGFLDRVPYLLARLPEAQPRPALRPMHSILFALWLSEVLSHHNLGLNSDVPL